MAASTVRVEGLSEVLKTLKQLPAEMVSKRGGPVRQALRAAAKLPLAAAKTNVQRIIDTPNKDGRPSKSIGLLKQSLVLRVGKPRTGTKGEVVIVRVSKKRYPSERGSASVSQVAAGLEGGTENRRAMPFMRPAFDSTKDAAVAVFSTDINRRLARLVKKLKRQNRVKT